MADPAPESKNTVPQKKGGGAIIALGVLLLLMTGGLVAYKVSSTKEEAPVIEEVKKAPAVDPSTELADPPPPPPPEEEVAEEKPAADGKATAPKSTAASACSGKCTGTEAGDFAAVLRARAGQARTCYNRGLRANATLEGKMSVSLRVAPSGLACSAAITSDTVGDPAVAACVVDKFRSGKYPAPSGGCIDASIPLNFVTK